MKGDASRRQLIATIISRRNYLTALWAARTVALEDAAASAFACHLMERARTSLRGIVPIVLEELEARGVHATPTMVRLELQRAEDRARAELGAPASRHEEA